MAPEIVSRKGIPSEKCDTWAVGAILNEVAAEPDGPEDRPCIGFQCRLPGAEES